MVNAAELRGGMSACGARFVGPDSRRTDRIGLGDCRRPPQRSGPAITWPEPIAGHGRNRYPPRHQHTQTTFESGSARVRATDELIRAPEETGWMRVHVVNVLRPEPEMKGRT